MNSTRWRFAAVLAAVAASATLLHFGTGLRPLPWLTWLAPLPVLVLAPRVGARTAFGAASAAWLGGETMMWRYYIGTLEMPPPVAALIIVGSALLFGTVVLVARLLMVRRRLLAAAFVVPAAWVSVEHAMSQAMPHGAWWSLAYTQADLLPVLQTASVTGPWGITFLVMGVPAAAAALLAPGPGAAGRVRVAVTAAVTLATALGYGAWHLRTPVGERPDKVALLATDHPNDWIAVSTPEGRELIGRYVTRVRALAAEGARVVVLPEKTFVADEASLPLLAEPLSRLAAERHIDIIAGLILTRGGVTRNAAMDFPAGGGRSVDYFKRHLIPGLEGELEPGSGVAFVPGSGRRWGITICKDLDFPGLVRDYRARGATAMLVPALDFDVDAWLHSRMAVTRGVESGLTVARAARAGALTVSDSRGRILAEARSGDAELVSVTAGLPSRAEPTLYARFGDWFPWICVLLLLAGAAWRCRRWRTR